MARKVSKAVAGASNTPSHERVLLVRMVSRGELNRTGRRTIVKPFVVLAARCLGPGRLRLEMVKMAHDLGQGDARFGAPSQEGSGHSQWSRPEPPRFDRALRSRLSGGARVLPLWEAFLIQMNDFDRYLEVELRQMLDPVVAAGAPRRRMRKASGIPLLTVVTVPVELVAEALPAVETLAVPAQPAHLAP